MSTPNDLAFVRAPAKPATMFCLSVLKAGALVGNAVTVAAFWGETNWVADLISQLRTQWAFGMFALTLLFALARCWWWMLICLIGFSVNMIPIAPYVSGYLGSPDLGDVVAPESSERLRLMSLNLLTKNRQWDEVIESVREASPDYLVLMEVDSVWRQVIEEGLADEYPFTAIEDREDNFGIAFLSKTPWSRIEIFNSQTLKLPSIDVTFSNSRDKQLRLIATHPIPPMNQKNWNARNQQLTNVAQRFDDSTENLMVGDFNLSPWSPNFAQLVAQGKLVDVSKPFGPTPTWYVFPTWIGGLKIDHVLASNGVAVFQLGVGHDVGSDHRALVLDFVY